MTAMRKKIAEHMIMSKRTSAHVHGIFEVDVTRIVKLRESMKGQVRAGDGQQAYLHAFFARAVILRHPQVAHHQLVDGRRQHPLSPDDQSGHCRRAGLGIDCAVVKSAEERSFVGLQRAISDIGERARTKKLKPDEVQGGTFTITNPGIFGAEFGLPIINQPQVAILGVGGIKKKPVVLTDKEGNDTIAIRSMMPLEHRLRSPGYRRCGRRPVHDEVKKFLQNWNEALL